MKRGKRGRAEDKAKFRIMHHKFHDEPEWHVDDPKDAAGSVVSDVKKIVEKKFKEEFNTGGSHSSNKDGLNIFHGNLG
jgi:hypothetical protein